MSDQIKLLLMIFFLPYLKVSVQGELKENPPTLYVSGLRSGGPILDKATIRCIMEGSHQPIIVETAKDILIFREVKIHEVLYMLLKGFFK